MCRSLGQCKFLYPILLAFSDCSQLKKNFGEVQAIQNASGFGWDEGTKTCTASLDVWEKYIAVHSISYIEIIIYHHRTDPYLLKAHPNAARWRMTSFPLYDDIHFLVNGIVATGAGAFHPGRSISPSATQSSGGDSVPTESPSMSTTFEGSEETKSSSSSSGILHDSLAEDIMDSSGDPQPTVSADFV